MTDTPASIVIQRFGGIKAVADVLGLERTAVQRWTYGRDKGTGGTVPQKHWNRLLTAAAESGLSLEANDLLPSELRAA